MEEDNLDAWLRGARWHVGHGFQTNESGRTKVVQAQGR